MAKLLTIFMIISCVTLAINSQGLGYGYGFGPVFGLAQAQYFQNMALQAATNRLALANLPEDLQSQATKALQDAEVGAAACDDLLQTTGGFWQYKRCSVLQMKNTLTQIAAIEQEAAARNTTTATSTA